MKQKKGIPLTEEAKHKISVGMKKSRAKEIKSLLDVSHRTIAKILERMNVGCSRCGWNESTCDIHHINGRQIENPNDNRNLCILCPNCHRLVHTHKISKNELVSVYDYIGDKWKDYYNQK